MSGVRLGLLPGDTLLDEDLSQHNGHRVGAHGRSTDEGPIWSTRGHEAAVPYGVSALSPSQEQPLGHPSSVDEAPGVRYHVDGILLSPSALLVFVMLPVVSTKPNHSR